LKLTARSLFLPIKDLMIKLDFYHQCQAQDAIGCK